MRAIGAVGLALVCLLGCSSKPLTDANAGDAGSGAMSNGGMGSGGMMSGGTGPVPFENQCTSALRESLGLVDEVATATAAVLNKSGDELLLYVDATAGGINGADTHPWVYVSLKTGEKVTVSDLDALHSLDWDIAFKRFIIRTNSGDSGPGKGGAIRISLPWDEVDRSTLGDTTVPGEQWFDSECMLTVDPNGELLTTYSGWSEYNAATHVLNAANAVFITSGADGALYKVAILDYYSTATGTHGTVPGNYKLRAAPLQ
jgi:hypothetical protein